MNRRGYLAATTAIAIAGCSSDNAEDSDGGDGSSQRLGSVDDCTIEQSTDSVEPVPVSVDGRLEDESADIELGLDWNARTQSGTEVEPDSNAGYSADEGQKTVVLRVKFINSSEEDVPISTKLFDGFVETPDTREDADRLSISARIVDDVILKPGGERKAYMAYEIPVNATRFTLRAVPPFEGTDVAFTPTCERNLAIELEEFSV